MVPLIYSFCVAAKAEPGLKIIVFANLSAVK